MMFVKVNWTARISVKDLRPKKRVWN